MTTTTNVTDLYPTRGATEVAVAVGEAVENPGAFVGSVIRGAADLAEQGGNVLADGIKGAAELVGAIGDSTADFAEDVINKGKDLAEDTAETVVREGGKLIDAGIDLAGDAADFLGRTGLEIAEKGSNGVTCVVNRSQPESLEPHCFDAEASETVLPIELRRTEMLREGKTNEEIDRDIGQGLLSGKYRLPRRPAMSYMMSSAQILYDDDGTRVGRWQPHLMIFYPNLTAADLGLGATSSADAAVVVDPGRPLSNIMVVVKGFVDPVP